MVHVHAFYPSEIQMVMKLAREYGFIDRLSFAHVTESFPIASVMAKAHVYPVVGYPNVARYWGDSVSHNVVKELMDAGVAASFETDMSGEQDKVFREYAASLVRHGLREDQALEAMTLNGAKALMLADRIGSIDVGKDADLVLMDGPPLDMHAERVEKVFVEGVLEYSRTEPRQKASLTAVGPFKPLKGTLPPGTRSYALTNAQIFTVSHGIIPNGTVVVKDGKIAEVKTGAATGFPKNFPVVDLGGRVILPGYMDARAFPNDWTGDLKWQVQNNEDLEPIMPEMNARHGIDVWFPSYVDLLEMGVIAQNITPGLLNMIGGSGVVMKTPGMDLDEKVRMEPSSMVMTLVPRALRTWTRNSQVPLTLDATVAMIRDTLTKAKEYAAKGQSRTYDQRLEAMLPAMQGKVPVIIHANELAEIEAALKLASDFNLRPIISGGVEAYKVADKLAKAKAGVILGMSATEMEAVRGGGKGYTDQSPLYLSRAGVKVSFFGFSGARRGSPKGRLGADPALNAAWAFRNGVPEDEALKMVTIYPAEMFGVDNRIGSIDVGKDADLLVLAGHPFDYHVLPELVIADGEVVVKKLPD
jgi:imidazolonepropionase-like amidohydrolase